MVSVHQRDLTRVVVDHCRRHGDIITTPEVMAKGGNSRQLGDLAHIGVLVRRHPGVYALAGSPWDHAAAVRAAVAAMRMTEGSPQVAASHSSAAWLQEALERSPRLVHLTTMAQHSRNLDGVVVHRTCQSLECRPFQGILCTLPARTLVDLAASATPAQLAGALDRALSKGIVRTRDLEAEIARRRRRGTDQLRRCLDERGLTNVPTPSVLESRMARLINRYGLPLPKGELVVGRHGEYRLDYANPAERLAVELYGYAHHHTPEQMAHDHRRQRSLTVQGWTVMVFTWREVTEAPERVARDIRAAAERPDRGIRIVNT